MSPLAKRAYEEMIWRGAMRALMICPLGTSERVLYEIAYSALWLFLGCDSFAYHRVHPSVFCVLRTGCFPQPSCWELTDAIDFVAKVVVGFPSR